MYSMLSQAKPSFMCKSHRAKLIFTSHKKKIHARIYSTREFKKQQTDQSKIYGPFLKGVLSTEPDTGSLPVQLTEHPIIAKHSSASERKKNGN